MLVVGNDATATRQMACSRTLGVYALCIAPHRLYPSYITIIIIDAGEWRKVYRVDVSYRSDSMR